MCAGDSTLEKAIVVDAQVVAGVNGWNVTHQCRDWASLYDFASSHRAGDEGGIFWGAGPFCVFWT